MSVLGLALSAIMGIIGLVVAAILIRAWVLVTLWGWFIPPMFVGAPEMTITTAIGISLIVGMFTHHLQTKKTESGKTKGQAAVDVVAHGLFAPLVTLAIGWVVTLFM